MELLVHSNQDVRRQATDTLFRVMGQRALPVARRMLTEKDYGFKSSAALHLGLFGTLDDLKILIPLSNFWTGDRANHYWLSLAVAEIRRRHGYDLNGRIKN